MIGDTENKLRITIHVYDTDLTVNVPRAEEEYYRKGAKLITDVVNSYASYYKGVKADKELLYMSLIDIALRYVKEAGRNDVTPFNDILAKLTSEIEETMK